MTTPSLQQGIDDAGSPMRLLWKPNAPGFTVPVVPPEFVGWREEQASWRHGAAFMNQSFHMRQIWIEGPDAKRMLSNISVNDYEDFVVGRAKQFVPVTPRGHIITDAIVMRMEEQKWVISGVAASETWIRYHAESGEYDVTYLTDPNSGNRFAEPNRASPGMAAEGQEPILFRYQIQGPNALELVERALGQPAPDVKFFHSAPVAVAGCEFRAFRHGMAGMPGFEFIGEYADAETVKDAFLEAGKGLGIVQVGGMAYFTGGVESGWVPIPTPGIYTGDEQRPYREYVGLFTYEGQAPLHGSYFSENVEDYYVTPWELGYDRAVNFDHDFIGKAALQDAQSKTTRTKVTLRWDAGDINDVLGDMDYFYTHSRDVLEHEGAQVGYSLNAAHIAEEGTVIGLAFVDISVSQPGTELELYWGEHPGHGNAPELYKEFPTIKATVVPTPYNTYARNQYRSDALV